MQTVTVVVQPSGTDAGVVCGKAPVGEDGAPVGVGDAETVPGQYVVVYVVVMVVNPVGQILV